MVNRSHMLSQKRPSFNKNSPQKKNERTKGKTLFQFRCNEFIWVRFAKSQRSPRSTRMVAWLCWSLQANHESKDRGSLSLATSGVCFWCLEGWRLLLESSPHKLCFFLKDSAGFVPQNCQNCPRCPTDWWEPRIWYTWNEFSCHHSPLDSVGNGLWFTCTAEAFSCMTLASVNAFFSEKWCT